VSYNYVIVYTMGKVGSSTLVSSIQSCFGGRPTTEEQMRNAKFFSAHTPDLGIIDGLVRPHKLRSIPKAKAERLKWIIDNKPPIKLITAVRNPVERMISGVFHHWKMYQKMFVGHPPVKVMEDFHNSEWSLNWLDTHLLRDFGIDAYSLPFDFDRRCSIISAGNVEAMILRLEDVKHWRGMIKNFLEVDSIGSIYQKNRGPEALYKYRAELTLSQVFMRKMLNSKLAKHFYTENEREEFRSHYRKS